MRKINYKSDFDFILKLTDCKGEDIGWPDYDWKARLWTGVKANAYEVSCIGGQPSNCFNDEGRIHVVVNDNRMGPGRLNIELTVLLPDGMYPDGDARIVVPAPLEIELVRGAAACPSAVEVEAMLPYIKGEPFTYEDFTPEQIADLKRPATEAAERLDGFVKTASEAESIRETNERARVSAEQTRMAQETARQIAESTRQSNETKRVDAEVLREQAEGKREEAEALRTEPFAGFENEIDKAKRQVFIDMWNTACGIYGKYDPENAPDPEHPFYLNELWLTYEEAQNIYAMGPTYLQYAVGKFSDYKGRTVLPLKRGITPQTSYLFNNAKNLETTSVDLLDVDTATFRGCSNLREIIGVILVKKSIPNAFEGCANLSDIQDCRITASNAYFQDSPKLSLQTLYMMVEGSSSATITVHPDVYAKLMGDTTNAAAAALTPEELAQWQQVLTDAAEKNITFATA